MLPLDLIVNKTRAKVDIRSRMWNRLITATGQPRLNGGDDEEAVTGSDAGDSRSTTPQFGVSVEVGRHITGNVPPRGSSSKAKPGAQGLSTAEPSPGHKHSA